MGLTKDKHSSLFGVSNENKKFDLIDNRGTFTLLSTKIQVSIFFSSSITIRINKLERLELDAVLPYS